MLVQFTGFNPIHPTDDSQTVELDPADVSSVVSSITGDRHDFITITTKSGAQYQVKGTIAEINERLGV
jgi:hypothetical protein